MTIGKTIEIWRVLPLIIELLHVRNTHGHGLEFVCMRTAAPLKLPSCATNGARLWPSGASTPICWSESHFVTVRVFLFFFFHHPRGHLADRHQTLEYFATCLMVTQICKPRSEMWGRFPTNLAAQKHHNFGAISDNFAVWLRISPERNKKSSIRKQQVKCDI